MTDIFSKEKRSEIMSKIRSKNTSFEKEVFQYLVKNEVYFQRHYRRVPDCPDIALPRKKVAVFIDGDFWHGWKYSSYKDRLPSKFWRDKIESNIVRDKKNRRLLRKNGWRVLRVWEHELSKKSTKSITLKKIKDFILEC